MLITSGQLASTLFPATSMQIENLKSRFFQYKLSCITLYWSNILKLKLPIKLVGTGEKLENLEKFDIDAYVDKIFS